MSKQEIVASDTKIIAADSLKDIQTILKNFKPSTKNEAIRMLAFLSITNNDATTKRLKDACTSFLLNRCAECENAVDPVSGVEVTKVERSINIYNDSDDVAKISSQIEELKCKLKDAQEKAGISHSKTTTYYKVKI